MIGVHLSTNAARYPEATAMVFGPHRCSYKALYERCCRLANAMAGRGVGRGDCVAGLMNNCHQFIEILFAAAKLGAIFAPINFRLSAREVGQVLDDSLPKLMFVGRSVLPSIDELRGRPSLPQQIILVADQPYADEPCGAEDIYETWIGSHPADAPETTVASSDALLLMHSSGTTGQPKGAVWTQVTTLCSAHAKIIDFGLTQNDATAVFGPLFHVGPLMDLAVPVLLRGGKLVIGATTGFDPVRLLRTIEDERPTVMTVYPTMWRRILALGDLAGYDLASLRLVFTGGEPIPVPVLRGIYERFPQAGFINTYGSTEGGPITTFLAPEDSRRKIGSVGKPAFSVDIRIGDEWDRPLGPGQVGELLVRSPFVCTGYWRRSEETASAMRNGWWHTGDLAWCDEEGFVWIAGRKKDMIISGAENVYPIEVERVIAQLSGVADVAVIGVPDEEWGEAVAAYVVPEPGISLDPAGIVEHCRRNMASYKKPRHVIFVSALPRTTVNKVSKATLRVWFSRKSLGNQVLSPEGGQM